jgi:hypothetical protein
VLAALVAGAASADELLVGVLRDQDGLAVAGARISALDAAGHVVARDRSAADGTFAVAAAARPAAILVDAPDADPLRIAVPPEPGAPVAAVVRRHRAADLVPSAADVAALPSGSLDAVASVAPYRVTSPSSVSDRWLARGRGVTTIEGLPFYRRGDGGDATGLLPSHAFGAIDVREPLQAPWYGDRAGGGIVDARLFDRTDAARVTGRDASLAAGVDPAGLLAESWDPDGTRRVAAARASGAVGPFAATGVLVAGTAPNGRYAGAGVDLRAAARTFDVGAHVALTADDASTNATRDDGSVAEVDLDASGRGPNALAVRARWRDERGILGVADAQHDDAAIVIGTARGNVLRANAAVALAYGREHAYDAGTTSGFGVLPSLSLDAPLGSGWTAHAGATASTLGTPGFAIARSSLGEVGLAYTDRRRLRADVVAFAEGDLAPTAVNRGIAAAIGWQIAPRVSLRAWSVRDADLLEADAQAYPGGPLSAVDVRRTFNRDVAWLTWDGPVRVDVLLRGGAVEGGVRVPLGARYALALGSFVRGGTRVLTAGAVRR